MKYWEIIADRLHAEGWSYGIAEHFTKHGLPNCNFHSNPAIMKTRQITATTLANLVPLAVVIAAAMLSQPLFAQGSAHDLQITENSSTSLSATFDGSAVTVLNTAPDRWTLTFPNTFTFATFTINGWNEPESGLGNILDSPGTNQLFVLSDIGLGSEGIPDGTTMTNISSYPGT